MIAGGESRDVVRFQPCWRGLSWGKKWWGNCLGIKDYLANSAQRKGAGGILARPPTECELFGSCGLCRRGRGVRLGNPSDFTSVFLLGCFRGVDILGKRSVAAFVGDLCADPLARNRNIGANAMDDSELLSEFVEEAREHLGNIELQLTQIGATGADIDANLVDNVARAIHFVKGAAGLLGLSQINAVSHRLEHVLKKMRDRVLIPDPLNVDVMFQATGRLKTMIETVGTSNETDNSVICQKLDEILNGRIVKTNPTPRTAPANEPKPNSTRHRVKRSDVAAKAAAEVKLDSPFKGRPTHRSGSAAQPKTPSPKGRGRKDAATPGVFVAARASDLLDAIAHHMADVETAAISGSGPAATSPGKSRAGTGPNARDSKVNDSKMAPDPTPRVGARVLDRLINLAGKLGWGRNQLVQALKALSSNRAADQRRAKPDAKRS